MPLLLVPALILLLVALVLLLWPLALWQRYRLGKARRRALPWVVALNAWASGVSLPLFVLAAWIGAQWIAGAAANALAGLLAGGLVGLLGLRLARFEREGAQLHVTPHPAIVLGLTVLVAARVLLAAGQAWHRAWHDAPLPLPWPWLADPASLWAMAGLLLGCHAVQAWGLRRRMRALRAR